MRGGYKIIDVSEYPITEIGTEQEGDYSKIMEMIEANFHKNLMISGLKVEGLEYDEAFPAIVQKNSESYTIAVAGLTIIVSENKIVAHEVVLCGFSTELEEDLPIGSFIYNDSKLYIQTASGAVEIALASSSRTTKK